VCALKKNACFVSINIRTMETFKINKSWEEFKPFVEKDLANVDTFNIGYMFNDNEVIVRSEDESITAIIKKVHIIIPCELPANATSEIHYWNFFGNSSFFRD
jgi:hypothetical protein